MIQPTDTAGWNGWHPIVMACFECRSDIDEMPRSDCGYCNGTGWRPDAHALYEGLFIDGACIATVEQFDSSSAVYANAITPASEPRRSGAMHTQADAMDWCERVAALKPSRAGAGHAGGREVGG